MRKYRPHQARRPLSTIIRRFTSTQSKSNEPINRYFPHGFTIPSPNFSASTSPSAAKSFPIEHSLLSKFLAPGYEAGGRLEKLPNSLDVLDEKGLMRWGDLGIPLTMVTGASKSKTFTHRL